MSQDFDFLFKIKIRPLQLNRHRFRSKKSNWLQFGQFLSDFEDSHLILTRIVSQIWFCFQNKNWTIVAQTATILVCVIEFPSQNWAGWLIHRFIFFGGVVFLQPFMCRYIKSTLPTAMADITLTWGIPREKSKLFKKGLI